MIKNTELEFEHRRDISCDNFWRGYSCLPISLSKVEERSGHFTILGHDFDMILGQIVLEIQIC